MKRYLIVAHQPSKNTKALAKAAEGIAISENFDSVQTIIKTPFETQPKDVLGADAILLGTTENLGYMSGALKDFFDRCYYPVLEEKQGLPCALYIRAGHDGTGTQRAVESIVTGLRWRWIQPPLICRGDWDPNFIDQVSDLSLTVAASLDAGII